MFDEAVLRKGKARLVNNQARVDLTGGDGGHDGVITPFGQLEVTRLREFEQQVGRRQTPRNRNLEARKRFQRTFGDDQRPHPEPERAARAEHDVFVGKVKKGVIADFRNRQRAAFGELVERFNVLEPHRYVQLGRDFSVRERVEDKTVVGTGGVA